MWWLVEKKDLYDNIAILGGEPLHQEELEYLLSMVSTLKPVWLYTSYEIDEVPDSIKQYCTYIKTGQYIEELKASNIQEGILLASSNQKIVKVR